MQHTPLTRIEKIATLHVPGLESGQTVAAGDFVRIQPVHVMTHDNTSAVMGKFKAIGASSIHDKTQPIFAIDHDIQNHSSENLGKYARIESFANAHDVRFYPAGTGISHQVMIERGHVTPGAMVVGSDSHSNIYGAIAALGTPVVRTDAASIWATGETWWQVPQIAKVTLKGKLRPGVTGKDVIIALCGVFNQDEVLNHAVEFDGDGVACLSMDQRMAIANMTTEWGALAGVFPFDLVLKDWLTQRSQWLTKRRTPTFTPEDVEQWYQHRLEPDTDAHYAVELELDLDTVIPHVSGPDHVKIMHALPEIEAEHVDIQKAYLLSCVNGRLEDLRAAATVLQDAHVAEGVSFYVAAASKVIQGDAEADGTWSTLERAGAIFLPPGCGTCIGLGEGTLEPGETGISATNRNFKGRMGARDAKAYLASPAVVAASAAAGYICSPEPFETVKPVTKTTINGPRASTGGSVSIIEGFEQKIDGRVLWLGVDNMNTDGIYAGAMTYRDDVTEADMAAAAMANYDPAFVGIAQAGDIIVSGENFGTGSSREQAATCLQLRGIACVVAASFSQTYVRNAINNGFICLTCPALSSHLRTTLDGAERTLVGGTLDIDFARAVMSMDGREFSFTPLGEVPQAIIVAGGAEAVVRQRLDA